MDDKTKDFNFNPHSHEGSDCSYSKLYRLCFLYFNPHSHEGSDNKRRIYKCGSISFQSTLPRRERLCFLSSLPKYLRNFNPHSHEGSDFFSYHLISRITDFNPHSHEGSDFWYYLVKFEGFSISIHTPTKGATRMQKKVHRVCCMISIHTPTKGAT